EAVLARCNMTPGSCLCGAVAFEIDPAGIVISVGCFCTNCRKVSGSDHGVYLQGRPDGFKWIKGEAQGASHEASPEASPGNRRGFCRICGAVAPIATAYGAMRVPGGALDDDPGVRPDVTLFNTSRAEWCSVETPTNAFADAGPQSFWAGVIGQLFA